MVRSARSKRCEKRCDRGLIGCQPMRIYRAGEGIRTLDVHLGKRVAGVSDARRNSGDSRCARLREQATRYPPTLAERCEKRCDRRPLNARERVRAANCGPCAAESTARRWTRASRSPRSNTDPCRLADGLRVSDEFARPLTPPCCQGLDDYQLRTRRCRRSCVTLRQSHEGVRHELGANQ
jgi:hypothetical protein